MDRRYYRKHENYDTVIPRAEDFPVLNAQNEISNSSVDNSITKADKEGFKTDDLILLAILVLLLMEEEKDITAIFSVAALLFAGYIF